MRCWAYLVVLGAVTSVASCRGETGHSSHSGASGFDDFLAQSARALCDRLFRCNTPNDDDISVKLILGSVENCEAVVNRVYQDSADASDLRAEVASGATSFVPEATADCLSAIASCEFGGDFDIPACRTVFAGTVPEGQSCYRGEDCEGDSFCEVTAECPGTCQPRKAPGESCGATSECSYQAGSVTTCAYGVTGEGTCVNLSVASGAGSGETCSARLPEAGSIVTCAQGLWCDAMIVGGETAPEGTCRSPIPLGGSCDDDDDVCAGGYCDSDQAKCVSVTIRKKAGESCDKEALVVCDPFIGLACVNGVCVAPGDGSLGSTCHDVDYEGACDPGLYCDQPEGAESGICARRLPAGQTCNSGSACESGDCSTGVCGERFCSYG